jgi:hypothetical protein
VLGGSVLGDLRAVACGAVSADVRMEVMPTKLHAYALNANTFNAVA